MISAAPALQPAGKNAPRVRPYRNEHRQDRDRLPHQVRNPWRNADPRGGPRENQARVQETRRAGFELEWIRDQYLARRFADPGQILELVTDIWPVGADPDVMWTLTPDEHKQQPNGQQRQRQQDGYVKRI